jgi:hypothetical protein
MWDAEYDMASTTFGSIAPDDVQEGDWLKYTNEDVGLVLSLTKTDFLYGAAMADILGCILFLVMCVFFARRQRQIVRAVDEDSIEITDYSVMIKGLPEDATDKEEVRCFFELKFCCTTTKRGARWPCVTTWRGASSSRLGKGRRPSTSSRTKSPSSTIRSSSSR